MALHECGEPAAVGRVDFAQIYHHVKFAAVDEPGEPSPGGTEERITATCREDYR